MIKELQKSKQTVDAENSFITLLMQFVGSAMSALTCLVTLFLEHSVAPCLRSSAQTSGIDAFFFFFALLGYSAVCQLFTTCAQSPVSGHVAILLEVAGFIDDVYNNVDRGA